MDHAGLENWATGAPGEEGTGRAPGGRSRGGGRSAAPGGRRGVLEAGEAGAVRAAKDT